MMSCEDLVDLVALGEQLVERVLAEHRAQRRLGDLRRRDEVVLDLRDRGLRIDDAEVRHRGHPHGHVVLRDDLLRRDRQRDGAQVGLDHPVDERHEQDEARALRSREQAAEAEDDAALVLPQHADRRGDDEHGEDDEDGGDGQQGVHAASYVGSGLRGGLALDLEHETALPRDADALAGLGAAGGQLGLPALAVDEHLAAAVAARVSAVAGSPTSVDAGAARRQAAGLPDARDHERAISPSEPAIASTSQKLAVP